MTQLISTPHITCIPENANIGNVFKLQPCNNEECGDGCSGLKNQIHCPICPLGRFKAARLDKVISHLQKTHFSGEKGVCTVRGYIVSKCPHPCSFNDSKGHFHCPLCDRQLRRKQDFIKHAESCNKQIASGDMNVAQSESSDNESESTQNDPDVPLPHTTAEETQPNRDNIPENRDNTPDMQSSPSHEEATEEIHQDDVTSLGNTSVCSYCKRNYAKTFLKEHIRRVHLEKSKIPDMHYSVTVDRANGIYAVAIRREGVQHPTHVMRLVSSASPRIECGQNTCNDLRETEARSGNLGFMCIHLRSVEYCNVNGIVYELDDGKLEEMKRDGFMNASRGRELLDMKKSASVDNVPLIVFIPPRETNSSRYQWYSVYSNRSVQQYWSKFNRVIVTVDTDNKKITCKCRTKACIHSSVIRWHKYQMGEESVHYAIDNEEVDGADENEVTNIEVIKLAVGYMHKMKRISNRDLSNIKFNPNAIPTIIEPSEKDCFYCKKTLKPSVLVYRRPVIVCEDRPPITTETVVKIKECPQCSCRYHYQDWKHGIFNFNNRLFISIPLLIHIRSLLSEHTAVSRTISALQTKLDIRLNDQDMKNAYFAFEAMVDHEYKFTCVRCGIHPKALVYDLTKKAIFDFEINEVEIEEDPSPVVNADEFWTRVEKQLIARGMVKNSENPFNISLSYSKWAPFIGVETRASPMLYNTEYEKVNSQEVDDGEPISEELMCHLLQTETTTNIRKMCQLSNVLSSGSRIDMLTRLRNASLTKAKFDLCYAKIVNRSGGWLSGTCPHNVTYAVKFLLRTESPRDYVDVMKSFKHIPTINIIDIAHNVAKLGNRLYPGMYGPTDGRLLESSDEYIKAVEEKRLCVSIPAISNDIPLKNPEPNRHPITGMETPFCLFDWFHQDNTKNRNELLRRASLVREIASYINTQAAEQLHREKSRDIYWMNQLTPANHIFCFRLICTLKNDQINRAEINRHRHLLNNFTPSFNDLGQLIRSGCTAYAVDKKDTSVSVIIKPAANPVTKLPIVHTTEIVDSSRINENDREHTPNDGDSLFRSLSMKHSKFKDYTLLRREIYQWCLLNRDRVILTETQLSNIGTGGSFVNKNTVVAAAYVLEAEIQLHSYTDSRQIKLEIFKPPNINNPCIYLYYDPQLEHYEPLTSINTEAQNGNAQRSCSRRKATSPTPSSTSAKKLKRHRKAAGEMVEWPCQVCRKSTNMGNVIECSYCECWEHYKCRGIMRNDGWIDSCVWKCSKCIGNTTAMKIKRHGKEIAEAVECPCQVCGKSIDYESQVIECSYCDHWEHYKCRGITRDEPWIALCEWKCIKCSSQ